MKKTVLKSSLMLPSVPVATMAAHADSIKEYQLILNHEKLSNVMVPIEGDMKLEQGEYQDCFVMDDEDRSPARVYESDATDPDSYIIPTGVILDMDHESMNEIERHRANKCEGHE